QHPRLGATFDLPDQDMAALDVCHALTVRRPGRGPSPFGAATLDQPLGGPTQGRSEIDDAARLKSDAAAVRGPTWPALVPTYVGRDGNGVPAGQLPDVDPHLAVSACRVSEQPAIRRERRVELQWGLPG